MRPLLPLRPATRSYFRSPLNLLPYVIKKLSVEQISIFCFDGGREYQFRSFKSTNSMICCFVKGVWMVGTVVLFARSNVCLPSSSRTHFPRVAHTPYRHRYFRFHIRSAKRLTSENLYPTTSFPFSIRFITCSQILLLLTLEESTEVPRNS